MNRGRLVCEREKLLVAANRGHLFSTCVTEFILRSCLSRNFEMDGVCIE